MSKIFPIIILLILISCNGKQDEPFKFGLIRSFDGGKTWEETGMKNYASDGIAIDPQNPCVIYYGIYRSIDCGNSWNKIDNGLLLNEDVSFNIDQIVIDPADNKNVYLLEENTGLYKLNTTTETWELVLSSQDFLISGVKIREGNVYISGATKNMDCSSGLKVYNNSEGKWISKNFIGWIYSLDVDFNSFPNVIYLNGEKWLLPCECGLEFFPRACKSEIDYFYRSFDEGESFAIWKSIRSSFIVHPNKSSTLFSSDENGLYISEDGGDNWVKIYNSNASIFFIESQELLYKHGFIYIIDESCKGWDYFEISLDRGNTWNVIKAEGYRITREFFTNSLNIIYAEASKCE